MGIKKKKKNWWEESRKSFNGAVPFIGETKKKRKHRPGNCLWCFFFFFFVQICLTRLTLVRLIYYVTTLNAPNKTTLTELFFTFQKICKIKLRIYNLYLLIWRKWSKLICFGPGFSRGRLQLRRLVTCRTILWSQTDSGGRGQGKKKKEEGGDHQSIPRHQHFGWWVGNRRIAIPGCHVSTCWCWLLATKVYRGSSTALCLGSGLNGQVPVRYFRMPVTALIYLLLPPLYFSLP